MEKNVKSTCGIQILGKIFTFLVSKVYIKARELTVRSTFTAGRTSVAEYLTTYWDYHLQPLACTYAYDTILPLVYARLHLR